jgi:hypothetical protein
MQMSTANGYENDYRTLRRRCPKWTEVKEISVMALDRRIDLGCYEETITMKIEMV